MPCPQPLPLDDLFQATRRYRSSAEYFELLEFIRRFPHWSPYNAMLLHVQNPAATYTATAARWRREFGRRVRPGARPLVVLVPFGPVGFVYDVADTDGPPLPPHVLSPLKMTGRIDAEVFSRTITNCDRDRILVVQHEHMSPRLFGCVRRGKSVKMVVMLNASFDDATQYATLIHELAHVHCGHVGSDADRWWPPRDDLPLAEREFEAESVAWLVCQKAGIDPHSERYLVNYRGRNGDVPDISMEHVMRVAGYLESLGERTLPPRRSSRQRA